MPQDSSLRYIASFLFLFIWRAAVLGQFPCSLFNIRSLPGTTQTQEMFVIHFVSELFIYDLRILYVYCI